MNQKASDQKAFEAVLKTTDPVSAKTNYAVNPAQEKASTTWSVTELPDGTIQLTEVITHRDLVQTTTMIRKKRSIPGDQKASEPLDAEV